MPRSVFKLLLLAGICLTLVFIVTTWSIYFPLLNQSYMLRNTLVNLHLNFSGKISAKTMIQDVVKEKSSTYGENSLRIKTEESHDIIIKETEEILARRNAILRAACENLGHKINEANISSNIWRNQALTNKPRLYYSDKYKIVMCGVPKCGSTEWRKAILILENIVTSTSPDEIEHEAAFKLAWNNRGLWKRFDFRTNKGRQEIEKRLNSYYRIMTVREPLERIVSAFIDKLLPGGSGEGIYTGLSRNIHRSVGNHPKSNMDRATFDEFLTYILRRRPREMLDIHWRPYYQVCDPCRMNYHHIAKLETITRDADYVSKLLGINRSLIFPGEITDLSKERHEWKAKYAKYYEAIPEQIIKDIYKIFEQDYKLFGYDLPPFYVK